MLESDEARLPCLHSTNSPQESRYFLQTAQNVICFFFVIAGIDEAGVGDGGDAHLRGFGGGNARKSVLDDEAGVRGDAEFFRRAEVDVGIRFAVFDFLAGNNHFEKRRQSMSSEKWARGRADRACGDGEVQVLLPQLLQD